MLTKELLLKLREVVNSEQKRKKGNKVQKYLTISLLKTANSILDVLDIRVSHKKPEARASAQTDNVEQFTEIQSYQPKTIHPSQLTVLHNINPEGGHQEIAQDILEQIFPFPTPSLTHEKTLPLLMIALH
ncbi:hypothetical protein HNY73_017428 [Argiope bruennichi]|uniref:Uncharacterized protein n=1 Tax=Argiope bruennichi TaxID=94029 RepID=A0A8T0EAN8_ARGBR|nr:hypothetical protein HNY73_017428 [Argiope bruennichi]